MATVDNYLANPGQAYLDAASDPNFSRYILPEELTVVTSTDGAMQMQAQALAIEATAGVVRRIIDALKAQGAQIQDWICNGEADGGFDLCGKLKSGRPLGEIMRGLESFLNNKIVRFVSAGMGLVGFFTGMIDPVGAFVGLLTYLGMTSDELAKMCGCA